MSVNLSLYNAVSVLDRVLNNADHVLRKGEANAHERDIDPQVFLNARLAPDMGTLIKQVQILASLAKNCPYRIAGMTPPVYEETETTFDELYTLIAKARADIKTVTREDLDGKESREFNVKLGPNDVDFTGISYLSGFIIPNVYFHLTTSYSILRHNGVPLGKLDYMGGGI